MDKRESFGELKKMDKEQENTLRALKTGARAKAHIVNGGGIKYVAGGIDRSANPQREAVANVAAAKGMTAYESRAVKSFDAEKALAIVKIAEANSAFLRGAHEQAQQRA